MRSIDRFLRLVLLTAVVAVPPGRAASADQGGITVLKIEPALFTRKWEDFPWRAWARADGSCLSFYQGPSRTALSFWGFRQSGGSSVEMIVGKTDPIAPAVVEVSLNDGPRFRKVATVEQFGDYRGYVIPLQPDALSIFPNKLVVDIYVAGDAFTYAVSTQMRNLEKIMKNCRQLQGDR